jgi:serine/threonine protein kinase/tetratricopeptide (TPR) repeat protein
LRFERHQRVARGAYGEIFRGVERATGMPVAIKRLHEHRLDAATVERFEREAQILASVRSEYVVRYLAHGRDEDGRPCLVLPWIEGEDLGRIHKTGELVLGDAVEIARQALLGLGALHAAGVVHGDVKPSNFLVSGLGGAVRVQLIDLGVARLADAMDSTFDGLIVGTPAYMSPEQARGDDDITPRSDLFSMGVVLYQLLSGRRPFTGTDPYAVLAKIVLEEPKPLITVATHVPAALDAAVMRALAKTAADRFASAAEMIEALERVPRSRQGAPRTLDETPTVQVSQPRLSTGLELRVVTAVFVGLDEALPGQQSGAAVPQRSRSGRLRSVDEKQRSAPMPDRSARAVRRDQLLADFAKIVGEHGGVVDRTIGGRMIAVFGASRSSGDEVERAVRAARQAIAQIGPLRVAITTGRAVAGAVGLSGESIERGAADVERARPGSIHVDATTARLCEASYAIGDEDGQRVVLAERGASPAAGPTLLGRERPFVGRDHELEQLEALFERVCRERQPQAALVVGAAGVGKSRLRWELVRRVRERQEPLLLLGRADSLGAGSPFGLLAQAIRRAAGLLGGEPLSVHQRKLRTLLSRHLGGKALARVTEFMGELAGVPLPDQGSPRLRAARTDAMLMGDAMLAAWEEWLAAVCEAQPVLLVLEDLQWGDLPTVKFVDAALRNLHGAPLYVLALARPQVHEEFSRLWSGRRLTEIHLGPLSVDAGTALVEAALAERAAPALTRSLVLRAEGNPFHLEELVRAVDAGSTAGDVEVPETVLGMVQARLDALGPDAKRVLRAASVFGRTFRRGGALALLGDGGAQRLDECLADLVAREVILLRGAARQHGDAEYAFRHALLRDAAYAMLTEEDRIAGHRLAGAWLERSGEPDATTLAEHFARGREPRRAVALYRRGAEQALEGHDLAGAIERAERGVSCFAGGDQDALRDEDDRELCGSLRLLQAEAHRWRGEFGLASDRAREAVELVPRGKAAWFRAVAEAIAAAGRLGRYAVVSEYLQRAAAASPELARASEGDPIGDAERAQIICLSRGVLHLPYAGLRAEAEAVMSEVLALAGELDRLDPIAAARVHQMRAVRSLHAGDPAGYLADHQAALAAFVEVGDARSACLAQVSVGSGCVDLGLDDRAEVALREALAGAERMGLFQITPWALQNLGNVLLRRGELAEARAAVSRALEAGMAQGDARLAGGSRIYLAMIAEREGSPAVAEAEARTAAETLQHVPPMRAGALAVLSRALRARGAIDEALAMARQAMELLASLGDAGMGELEIAVRLSLVEALRARGLHADAARALAVAHARLQARAETILDEALRHSFLHRVPENARTLELARAGAP